MGRIIKLLTVHEILDVEHVQNLKRALFPPPALGETEGPEFRLTFEQGIEQSRLLAAFYRDAADIAGCAFFDAGSVVKTSPLDGVHLDAENTRAIGKAVAPIVRDILDL